LISNDIEKVSPSRAIWAAFLTPQGKFLHEFMIAKSGDHFLLDCELDRREDLVTRLKRYRLRAKADIELSNHCIAAAWGNEVAPSLELSEEVGKTVQRNSCVVFVDPRLVNMGVRVIGSPDDVTGLLTSTGYKKESLAAFDTHRTLLGLPDGSRDMEVEKALLLENGFEELGGVDYQKGCYVGQELTARTHYRALIKKRLLPVIIDGPAPAPGTPLTSDGKDAGEMKSSTGSNGLALVRLAALYNAADGTLMGGEARLTPKPASWMSLPTAQSKIET